MGKRRPDKSDAGSERPGPARPPDSRPGGLGDEAPSRDASEPTNPLPPPDSSSNSERGDGGDPLAQQEISRADQVLLRMALRSHYDIPDEELRAVPVVLLKILASMTATKRTKISAARTLLELRRFTVDQVRVLHAIGLLNPLEEPVRIVKSPIPLPGDRPLTDEELRVVHGLDPEGGDANGGD